MIIFCKGDGPRYEEAATTILDKVTRELCQVFPLVESRDSSLVASNAKSAGFKKQKRVSGTIGVQLTATTDTGCSLSANGMSCSRNDFEGICDFYSEVVQGALGKLVSLIRSGACVDECTADQLVIYMANIPFQSKILCEPVNAASSLHLQTSMHFVTLLSGASFEIEEVGEYKTRLITCRPKRLDADDRRPHGGHSSVFDSTSGSRGVQYVPTPEVLSAFDRGSEERSKSPQAPTGSEKSTASPDKITTTDPLALLGKRIRKQR